jgi:hypothetical protein
LQAYIEGEYVDWADYNPPTDVEIVAFVRQRQRDNRREFALTQLMLGDGWLNQKEVEIITRIADLIRPQNSDALAQGIELGIAMAINHKDAAAYIELARKYNKFLKGRE